MTYRVTRVGRTESGWLCVEVATDGHQNDFLFPDTDDLDTVRRVIRDWFATHEAHGDHRGDNIVAELIDHELLGAL